MEIDIQELTQRRDSVNQWLERFGVRFGVYKKGIFHENLFPFDSVPRTIGRDDWAYLEKGLQQRVRALNAFLWDVYHDGKIIQDGVVPEEFVYSSKGFLPECRGISPRGKVYAHIAGIDLVEGKDNHWYVLEDNLRIPSGASYPMIARDIERRVSPTTFAHNHVADNRDYARLLRGVMDDMSADRGISVILTPGRYNSAFFEHSYLAEKTGAALAYPGDLVVEDGRVWFISMDGSKTPVDSIYRRVSDEYMDPLTFEPSSMLGVPNLMQAYRNGSVAIINALGNGVADDKGIYYFVPKMVKYYLGEEPILHNAPTYLPYYEEDKKYVLEHLDSLVIKDVSEAGGYGVVFGSKLTKEELAERRQLIIDDPRRWIAQEVVDFKDIDIIERESLVPRKADLRAFVLTGKETQVWKSGLTRFSRNPDSMIVNSSQGGGFKDTWVMA